MDGFPAMITCCVERPVVLHFSDLGEKSSFSAFSRTYLELFKKKKKISSQLYFSIGVILPELLMSGCCYFSVSDMGKNHTQRELSPWQN